jgi:hypothetical protein
MTDDERNALAAALARGRITDPIDRYLVEAVLAGKDLNDPEVRRGLARLFVEQDLAEKVASGEFVCVGIEHGDRIYKRVREA